MEQEILLEVAHITLATFHCPELSHVNAPYFKER